MAPRLPVIPLFWTFALSLHHLLLILSFLICASGAEDADDVLILSQLLWRHGDRSPVALFPTYNHSVESAWPMGLGALTRRGMKQHYLLGKELRKKFRQYLNATYDRNDILVMSTDFDRTLMSAQMNMAGLYGWLSSSPNDVAESPWKITQPIPIHPDVRGILSPGKDCPAFQKEKTRVERRSPDARRNRDQNGTLDDSIRSQTGNLSLRTFRIADTVFCSKQHDVALPAWIAGNQTILEYLDYYYFQLGARLFTYNDKLVRLGGGPLLSTMVEKMRDKIAGNMTQKVVAYSAHDVTIMALLGALGVFDGRQPYYASLVMIDLYRRKSQTDGHFSSKYLVEVKYLYGSRKPNITLAKTLSIPGCGPRCPLIDFITLLREKMPEAKDMSVECNGGESPEEALARDSVVLALSMVIALLVATLFFSCVFFLVRHRRMRNLLPTTRFSLIDDGDSEATVPLTSSRYDDADTYGYSS